MAYDHQNWEETRELGKYQQHLLASGRGDYRVVTRKRRPRRRRPGRVLFVILLLLVLLWLGYTLAGGHLFGQGTGGLLPGVAPGQALASERVLPVLLLGVDHRAGDVGRSDTMILAFLDLKDRQARLLSIPRDTYVHLPGRQGADKINAAYAYGGPEAATQAVSDLLGIEVNYYVETDFKGFERIVDTLGGVTLNVDRRMYYPAEGINLYPGRQRLDGHAALAFVRFRNYPMGDIDRIRHQQVFFQALADQALQIGNIWKMPVLVGELRAAVKTNLGMARLLELGALFRGIDRSRLESYLLPGYPRYIKGISYWIPREQAVYSLVTALAKGATPTAAR